MSLSKKRAHFVDDDVLITGGGGAGVAPAQKTQPIVNYSTNRHRQDDDDEDDDPELWADAEKGHHHGGDADGPELESAGKKDIALMIFINFLSFVCFAIVLPSLWPFLKSFGMDQSWVGWAVAVNSGGTFIASPILGKWTDWRGVKEALFVSLVVMIGGNVMYAMSQDEWMLLAARFVVGCAAANYAPASAYLTYATHPNDRTTVMIANSAASILGFILGPAMATGLSALPTFEVWKFVGNDLTYPGWASVLLAAFCLIFVPTVKNIKPRKDTEGKFPEKGALDPSALSQSRIASETNPYAKPSDQSLRSLKQLKQPGLPIWTVVVVLYLQFAFYTAFTVFETIGTPYTQHAYGWSVTVNGFLFAGIGGGCIISLVILQLGAMFLHDRTLLLVTEILMAGGFALLINYPFDEYVELPRFIVAVGCASVGFSSACAIVISIFSKLLENVEQGVMMGWLSASGSLARVAGPLFSAYVLQYVGGGLVFLITTAMLVLALILTLAFFPRLKTQHKSDTAAPQQHVSARSSAKKSKWNQKKSPGVRYADERPALVEKAPLINSEYDDQETWE